METKKIILIILGIFLISLVSAITYTLTAGETQIFDIGQVYDYYSIVGNSSEVDLNVTQTGTIVTITTSNYSPTDSFELIFFNQEKEIIYSSGGRRTITIIKNQTVEVPKYIDRNITVIKEVPSPKENKPDYTYLLLTGLIIALFLIIYLGMKLKKRNRIGNQKEDGKRKMPEMQQPENN